MHTDPVGPGELRGFSPPSQWWAVLDRRGPETARSQGGHEALDGPEGAVWRVEWQGKVDFLANLVRSDKPDGRYLPKVTGQSEVWNWWPELKK